MQKGKEDFHQIYSQFIRGLTLNEIYINNLSMVFKDTPQLPLPLEVAVDFSGSKFIVEKSEETNIISIRMEQPYILTAQPENSDEIIFKLKVKFIVKCTSEIPPTRKILNAYKSNLVINTWPFFRELAQNIGNRAGLPSLTLPFFKRLPRLP